METAPATTVPAQTMAAEVVDVFALLKQHTLNIQDTEKHLWSLAVQIVQTAHSITSK